jgi:pimeloyl-ACP methyl ester carboxylesterase
MASDLDAVVRELKLPRFHLAGVSMGGVIAQEYAVAHPGRLASLVLANTFAVADSFTRAAFDTWAIVAEAAGMPVMAQQQAPWIYSPALYARDPGRVAELVAGAEQSTQPAAAFAAQMAALNNHDCTGRIGSVTVPTLVLAASDDIIIRSQLSRQLFELMPESSRTWAVVPGGHAAFWEDPGPWNQAVIEFVRASSARDQRKG